MVHFAYQDESQYGRGTGQIFCVTALVFGSDLIHEVVQAMHSDFQDLHSERTYDLGLFIHGRDMLPSEPDERKLKAFDDVAKIIARFAGKIVRIGYYKQEFEKLSIHPFGLIHMAMMNALTANFEGGIVEVYEMDLSGYRRYLETNFSGMIRHAKEISDLLGPENVSINEPHRIIESLFCPKKASWPLMMCDVAGHLLKVRHQREIGAVVGEFNGTLLPIADYLAPYVIHDVIVRIQTHSGRSETQ